MLALCCQYYQNKIKIKINLQLEIEIEIAKITLGDYYIGIGSSTI
jgi:hypothetical protein